MQMRGTLGAIVGHDQSGTPFQQGQLDNFSTPTR